MSRFLASLRNALVETPPRELVGALFAALVLSLVMAILYDRKRRTTSDSLTLLTVLMLVASVTSMALTLGYLHHAQRIAPAWAPSVEASLPPASKPLPFPAFGAPSPFFQRPGASWSQSGAFDDLPPAPPESH